MHLLEKHYIEKFLALYSGEIASYDKNQNPHNITVIADTLKQVRPQSSNSDAHRETPKVALLTRFVDGVIKNSSSTTASLSHTTRVGTNHQRNTTKDVLVSSRSKLSSMNQMNIQSTATDYDAIGTTSNDNDTTSEEKKQIQSMINIFWIWFR